MMDADDQGPGYIVTFLFDDNETWAQQCGDQADGASFMRDVFRQGYVAKYLGDGTSVRAYPIHRVRLVTLRPEEQ